MEIEKLTEREIMEMRKYAALENKYESMDDEDNNLCTEHTFRLRPDLVVVLELPLNITTQEAQRLADFIKTLPFAKYCE